MSIVIKVSILILLTYFWAKGLTLEYEERIKSLEDELKNQKKAYEEKLRSLTK